MGANVSTQSIKNTSQSINNVLNSFTTQISTESNSSSTGKQLMQVELNNVNCKKMVFSQVLGNRLQVLNKLNTQQLNKVSAQLKNAVKKDIEQAAAQTNSGLNLGQANVSSMNQTIDTYLENNIKNVVNSTISTTFSTTTKGEQIVKFNGKNMNCNNLNISQEMVIEQMSTNISKNLLKNSLDAVASNKDILKAKQKAVQKNVGLSLGFGIIFIMIAIAGMFFFNKILMYIIPIGIIISIILIVYYKSKNLIAPMIMSIVVLIILIIIQFMSIYMSFKSKNL